MSQIIKSIILTTLPVRKYTRAFAIGSHLLFAVALAALLVALALTAISASEAPAATTRTIDVDNIDDNNPTAGCTLREAIDVANAGLGAGTAINGCTVVESGSSTPITYEIKLPSYTYTLSGAAWNDDNTGGDLDILANMTIMGTGASSTIIDGNGIDRVFHLPIAGLGITLHLSNVTIQNGYLWPAKGGGICNNGNTVYISDSTVTNNWVDGSGGGIENEAGTLIVSNCTISDNMASNGGAGINSSCSSYVGLGTLIITNSIITGNQMTSTYYGGGGGISVSTDVGKASIKASIMSSTISNNTAYDGGGIYNVHYSDSDGTPPTLNISNSTIANNTARHHGGGIKVTGGLTTTVNIANTTISGNSADQYGGGIFADNDLGSTSLINVTISDNVADANNNGTGDGGGIINDLYGDAGAISVKNSIIAGNSDLSGNYHDCLGTFASFQYNLIGKNTGCIFSFPAGHPNINNDLVGTGALPLDPLLGPLAYDGGDTWTHALLPGSPAINAIPVANCSLATDQRGAVRPCGTACDIGAYERVPDPLIALTKEANDDTPLPGQVITYTVSVENRGYFTATNGFISDTLPTGLVFAGPIILEPPGVGNTGVYPILAYSLTIPVGQHITATFPITVQTGVVGVITNTAVFSSTELVAPQVGSKAIAVGYHIYLPQMLKNYSAP